MASITLTLYGDLNRFVDGRERTLLIDLSGPSTAGELLEKVGVPVGMLAMVLLNGQQTTLDARPADGDALEVFPACGGGSRAVGAHGRAPLQAGFGVSPNLQQLLNT